MVEELKLAIKVDDDSIEQSLLKQFANAQKMADKVVLDFKNVNFDDKEIEAKFKALQKKAGQNPIDLTINNDTLGMLNQIDTKLTEIFNVGKSSFIDSSATISEIGKIVDSVEKLNSVLDKSFDTKSRTEAYKQLKDSFKNFDNNIDLLDGFDKAGVEAAYSFWKSYEEALNKNIAESRLEEFGDSKYNKNALSEGIIDDYKNILLDYKQVESEIAKSNNGILPSFDEDIIKNINNYVYALYRIREAEKDIDFINSFPQKDEYNLESIANDNNVIEFYKSEAEFRRDWILEQVKSQKVLQDELSQTREDVEKTSEVLNKPSSESNNNSQINELKSDIEQVKTELGEVKEKISTIDTEGFENVRSDVEKTKESVKELNDELTEMKSNLSSTPQIESNISSGLKDAIQGNGSEVSVAQKIADNFEEVKQNTDKATESAKDYIRVLSQVGELGVDAKVSAMYQRNDGQLESVSWRAKRDDQGQILYDKNGNVDYEEPVMTVISKYEQLEKIIIKADNELRDLQKTLSDTQSLDPTASTTNIEKQIQYQKDYIQLLEQTVKTISQQDEYLLYEQQIIDARNKAENEYNLKQGTKSDVSNAKQLASEEQKRQKNIEQTNRLLNRQQITIDTIEKSYNKIANPDLDKSVSGTSDLIELSKKKSEIQNLINQLNGQSRNSSNEQEFLQLEKLISEYKQLAKDKLKANNPSKQELGGQDLTVLLEQQVAQYNQLITKAEKYGDATSDIVDKLKTQRDLIAQANSDGVYTAKSGLKADDYYSARDNYKIGKAQFSSYETDIKNTEKLIQAQKELGEATTKARQAAKDSTQSSVDNALKEQVTAWKNIQSIREKITKTKDTDEIANLHQIKKEYQQNYIEADKILKANSSLYDKEIQVAKLEQIRVETNKKIADYNDKQVSGFDKRISGYESKLTNYQATANKFKDGGWTSDAYNEQIDKLNKTIGEYKSLLASMQNDSGLVTDKNIEQLNEYEAEIKEVISTVSNMSAAEKGFSFLSAQKELDKINSILNENTAMSREAKAQIRAYYAEIKSGNPSASLDVIHAKIMEIVNAEVEAGRGGKSMWSAIKEKAWYGVAGAVGTYFGFNDILRYGGEVLKTVRELDTAYTEMRKVTDESAQSLKNFQKESFSTADSVGTTALALQDATATWMRLGESLDQAKESAKDATVLLNVSEFENIDEATDSLVAMSQAYKELDKMEIIDVLDKIGNEYSISTDQLSTALKDSAAVLKTQGNDLAESVALITAGNAITQDASKTAGETSPERYRNIFYRTYLTARAA